VGSLEIIEKFAACDVTVAAEVAAAKRRTHMEIPLSRGSIVPIQHLLNPTNGPSEYTSGPRTQQHVLVEVTS
jgi:hypothetical protein